MTDFLTAIGLMFVMEGVSYALFPEGIRKMMERVIMMPQGHVRFAGLTLAGLGFVIIAVIRSF
ncbi:MAG: DUF2065 domain-containing protein [Alphaproteobacteria bacterium]|nr:DUF2065 domain-containing protein [Alphaproteobacteria bacterium]MCK5518810.1 DUF2065 domain-containing protein [Alphaproteobacteria bacterium]MCK5555314.1 DUF2065 domain-containing protein [Alphaproteobacteria bacterium]MCK5659469.1 DUF2065 domain-containing protein [Alphaproteobacteria bacterium]